MISGHANIELAVKAAKLGAYDFIEKPLSLEKVLLTVNNALTLSKQLVGQTNSVFGDKLIQLTWQSKVGFVYTKDTFTPLRECEQKQLGMRSLRKRDRGIDGVPASRCGPYRGTGREKAPGHPR